MWNKDKSIVLSKILIVIMVLGITASCIFAPQLVREYDNRVILEAGLPSVFTPLLVTLYCCVPPALIALISLYMLLINIQQNKPFIKVNIVYLRIISYCCFAGAVIFVYFAILRPFAWVIVAAALFFGIILRVVKNCFQQAVAIREENDFTI